jgi:formiminotetrahydrofolate cyclodeaminase
MELADQKINQFLTDLAAKKPAPGGGSASALAGAMAAALVEKVAVFTVGKEKYQPVEKEFREIITKAKKLRQELLDLVEKDTKAYQAVIKTKNSQEAIEEAARVPLETAQKSLAVFKMAILVSEKGNQNLRSDAFCALELATASIYGALENVRANLPFLKDKRVIEDLQEKIETVLNGTQSLVKV